MICEEYCEIRLYDALKRAKNRVMKLSYDPYMVFKPSKTPAGLYARQK